MIGSDDPSELPEETHDSSTQNTTSHEREMWSPTRGPPKHELEISNLGQQPCMQRGERKLRTHIPLFSPELP